MASVTKPEITHEEVPDIEDRPMPELVDGELLERETGQKSDSIAATCLILLGIFVRDNKLGLVNGSQGSYQVSPDRPKMVRIPDVSFTRRERLSKDGPSDGHGRIAPDLIVEVDSPNDQAEKIQQKIDDFLAAGIPLLWIIYPETRTVMVLRRDGTANFLKVGDILSGEDIVPGFQVQVADLFE